MLIHEIIRYEPLDEADIAYGVDMQELTEVTLVSACILVFLVTNLVGQFHIERPAFIVLIDLPDVKIKLLQEMAERQFPSCVCLEQLHLIDDTPLIENGRTDIVKDISLGDLIHRDSAPAGKHWKSFFYLRSYGLVGGTEQRTETALKAIVVVSLQHEVEDRKTILVRCQTKTTAELLKEYSKALGRSEKEDSVNLRNINTLIEDIYHTEIIYFPRLKALQHTTAALFGILSREGIGAISSLPKSFSCSACMLDVDAEAERPTVHLVSEVFRNRGGDEIEAVARIEFCGKLTLVVSCCRPSHIQEIGRLVAYTEILERAQQHTVDGFWQTDLRGYPVIKIR